MSAKDFAVGVGKRIRAIMKIRGVSESVAASRLGVSQTSISVWKRGLVAIPLYRAWQLAVLLNVKLEDLLPKEVRNGDS